MLNNNGKGMGGGMNSYIENHFLSEVALAACGFEHANKTQIPNQIWGIHPHGGTAMRDALIYGNRLMLNLHDLLERDHTANNWNFLHVMITDGHDTDSNATYHEALKQMQQIRVNMRVKDLKIIILGVGIEHHYAHELKKITREAGAHGQYHDICHTNINKMLHSMRSRFGLHEERLKLAQYNMQQAQLMQAQNGQQAQQIQYQQMQQMQQMQQLQQMQFTDPTQQVLLQQQKMMQLKKMQQLQQVQAQQQMQLNENYDPIFHEEHFAILFSLDISGSMAGHKWDIVRHAVIDFLKYLGNYDLVSAVVFNDSPHLVMHWNTRANQVKLDEITFAKPYQNYAPMIQPMSNPYNTVGNTTNRQPLISAQDNVYPVKEMNPKNVLRNGYTDPKLEEINQGRFIGGYTPNHQRKYQEIVIVEKQNRCCCEIM